MRIIYLFPNFFFIGAQRAAAATIRKLKLRGWDISVVVFNNAGQMRNELPDSIPIINLPSIHLISRIPIVRIFMWPFALRKIMSRHKPDYCISICPQTNFTMVLYRLIFGKDVLFIGEEHQHLSNSIINDPADFKIPWVYLYKISIKYYYKLDVIRCVSQASKDDFIDNWGVPESKVKYVYPAFDLDRIHQRSHGKSRQNEAIVICSVGRLTSQKNFSLLIQAFHWLKGKTKLNIVLKIAGVGPEMELLNSLIIKLSLQDEVHLLGFVDYAEEIIASSNLFVMTSIWEGFPATLVEAMTLGTPVISVNCQSGPSELIDHGVNGLLVENPDPSAVGQAILKIIENPEIAQSMCLKAKEKVESFSLNHTVNEFEKLLLSIK